MAKGVFVMKPIGHVRSPYAGEKDVPKGLGAEHRAQGQIVVLPEYADGLLDIDGFSHLYVLWVFHRASGFALVSTPPCDDRPHGVFASRTPSRPNPIGLTTVRLAGRRGNILDVHGLDMVDGTPVLDLKPYLSSVPESELSRGWLAETEARKRGKAAGKSD